MAVSSLTQMNHHILYLNDTIKYDVEVKQICCCCAQALYIIPLIKLERDSGEIEGWLSVKHMNTWRKVNAAFVFWGIFVFQEVIVPNIRSIVFSNM